jgi:hypothetical protein
MESTIRFKLRKISVLLIHALILWALCGATIALGRSILSMNVTLIIHAIGAPVFTCIVTLVYYKKFGYMKPLQTALIFLLFIVAMDAGLVAPVFDKCFHMFRSLLGVWLPFILIFALAYITGVILVRKAAE